jgi:hypothetical protein
MPVGAQIGPDQPNVADEADIGYQPLRRHWRRSYATEGARVDPLWLRRPQPDEDRCVGPRGQPSRATMAAAGLTSKRASVSDEPDEAVHGADEGEVEYERHPSRLADATSRADPTTLAAEMSAGLQSHAA